MLKKNNSLLLWCFVIIYFFYFGLASMMKFASFSYTDFDLAVHDLAIWNILHGSIFNSILGIPFLGNHMHLILLLIAPLYLIFNSPLTLLLLQTASLALAVFPLYRLAGRLLDEGWALIISIIYLLYPGLGYANLFEFHPTVFAVPFLFISIYYYEINSFKKFVIFIALSMLCQENIALAVIMFGIMSIFTRRPLKWIITPIILGGLYFLIALFFLHLFNNNTVNFFSLYAHLGDTPLKAISNILTHPGLLVKALLRKQCFIFILHLFLPLLFFPLFAPLKLLPALPLLLQHVLSSRATDLMIIFHYAAELIPFLFVGFIYALGMFLKKGWFRNRLFSKVSLLLVALLSNLYLGPHFVLAPYLFNQYKRDYLDVCKDNLINKIPREAKVVATFELLSHLSHRRWLYSFHHIYLGFYTLSQKRYELPADVEYALIDFNDYLTFQPIQGFFTSSGYRNLQDFLSRGNWQVEDFMETIVLFRKNIAPKIGLCRFIHDADKEVVNKVSLNIDDDFRLIGYNLKDIGKECVLGITFYWECLRQSAKDMNVLLDIVDGEGNLVMRKIHPVGYRIFPTSTWKAGDIFKEEWRVKVPPDYLSKRYNLKVCFFDRADGRIYIIDGPSDDWGRLFLSEIR